MVILKSQKRAFELCLGGKQRFERECGHNEYSNYLCVFFIINIITFITSIYQLYPKVQFLYKVPSKLT